MESLAVAVSAVAIPSLAAALAEDKWAFNSSMALIASA
jgi:hypothetical protein